MCTAIAERAEFTGSAKGRTGWFSVGHLYVGYDHPVHVDLEHAVLLDFVDETREGARVAVELPRDAARDLVARLQLALDAADAYEAAAAAST